MCRTLYASQNIHVYVITRSPCQLCDAGSKRKNKDQRGEMICPRSQGLQNGDSELEACNWECPPLGTGPLV